MEHIVNSSHYELVASNFLSATKAAVLHEQSWIFFVVPSSVRRVCRLCTVQKSEEKLFAPKKEATEG